MVNRNPIILDRNKSALLIIDIQEKVLKVMRNYEDMITNVVKLIKGVKILSIPIYYTEQYPKGLGATIKEIQDELAFAAIQKMSFSCYGAENLFDDLKLKNLNQIIVCGIESHVCVQQTVLDLLANNFQVNLPADTVSSRKKIDYCSALERMSKHGAEITTVESVLFELLNVCGTEEFRSISKIVK